MYEGRWHLRLNSVGSESGEMKGVEVGSADSSIGKIALGIQMHMIYEMEDLLVSMVFVLFVR